jgi:arsenite methyltransferase
VGRRKDKPFTDQYARIVSHVDPRLVGRARELGYSETEIENVPKGAVETGLGCGNPTALAQLQEGQTVLDLGSGAGLDVFVASQKVGPRGKVIGVDATPEMVTRAQQHAREGRYDNVEFKLGRIEELPVPDQSVDVVISNCVLNHSSDKPAAFREALRVLRPGGKIHIADLVVEGPLPAIDSPGLDVWASWLAVASGKQEYLSAMKAAGFRDITIVTEGRYDGPAMTPLLAGKIVSLLIQARTPCQETRKGARK